MSPAMRIWIGTMFCVTSVILYEKLASLHELSREHVYLLALIGGAMVLAGVIDIVRSARRRPVIYRAPIPWGSRWRRSR